MFVRTRTYIRCEQFPEKFVFTIKPKVEKVLRSGDQLAWE